MRRWRPSGNVPAWAGKPTPSKMLTGIKNRGTRDVLMVVWDDLMGLPEAIARRGRPRVTQPCTVIRRTPASPMRAGATARPSQHHTGLPVRCALAQAHLHRVMTAHAVEVEARS